MLLNNNTERVMDLIDMVDDLKGIDKIRLAKKTKPKGLKENIKVARQGGQVAKNTREEIENLLGEPVVTNKNKLNYKYIDENKKIENK